MAEAYGGHERSALERYVVLEEMLAAGAPVSAHWVADRQSGPLLLRFGTEEQRQRFLPRIARGELAFAIGMSEPDSGSDLASIRTRAEKAPGGYAVTGTKIWTSNAHISDYAIALFRTHSRARQEARGAHPVPRGPRLARHHHPAHPRPVRRAPLQRGALRGRFVPEDMRVGDEGAGWKQVTTELAFERSGPERYLSSIQLSSRPSARSARSQGERAAVTVGRLVAHLATLRQMSLSVAGMLQAGQNPNLEAAVVKDVGTSFEQEIPEVVHALFGAEPRLATGSQFERILGYLVQHAPSFSLRGGTREVLRGIIARGLGLR